MIISIFSLYIIVFLLEFSKDLSDHTSLAYLIMIHELWNKYGCLIKKKRFIYIYKN